MMLSMSNFRVLGDMELDGAKTMLYVARYLTWYTSRAFHFTFVKNSGALCEDNVRAHQECIALHCIVKLSCQPFVASTV